MVRSFHLRRSTRHRLVWLVTLLLMWQQVALAAYVCQAVPQAGGQVTSVHAVAATDDGCADMGNPSTSPLCQQHCVPEHATQVDARQPSVPLSGLPALAPVSVAVAGIAIPRGWDLADYDLRRTSPPASRLLFCSLLI